MACAPAFCLRAQKGDLSRYPSASYAAATAARCSAVKSSPRCAAAAASESKSTTPGECCSAAYPLTRLAMSVGLRPGMCCRGQSVGV